MTHVDENTLELLVLGDPRVRKREKQIRRHLAECAGCVTLLEEIQSYYADVKLDVGTSDQPVSAMGRRALVIKRNGLEPYFASPDAEIGRYTEVSVPSFWRRMNRYRRENPGKTVFGFILLVAALFFSTKYLISHTQNPAYYHYDSGQNELQVYSASNRLLWSLPAFGLKRQEEGERLGNTHRTMIVDLDNNGRDEILTTIPVGNESWPFPLNVIDPEGKIVSTFRFPDKAVNYNNVKYNSPFGLFGLLKDTTSLGHLDLFVWANNSRSPTVLVRLNRHLKIKGEYWHYGTFNAWLVNNYDKTGKELILAGSDNSHDMSGRPYAFMAVLDPNKLVGKTQCSVTPGFGLENSAAGLYYVRFPLTDIERATGKRVAAMMERVPQDSVFAIGVRSSLSMASPGSFGFDYLFRKSDMSVQQVKFIMPTAQTYRVLKKKGKVHGTFNQHYLDNLKKGVRYWNGTGWVSEPTRILHRRSTNPQTASISKQKDK